MNHLPKQEIMRNRLAAINEMNIQFNYLVPKLIEHFKNNEPRFKQDGDLFEADRKAAPYTPTHEHNIRIMLTSHNGRINLAVKTTYTVATGEGDSKAVNYVSNWYQVYNDICPTTFDELKIHDLDGLQVFLNNRAMRKAEVEAAERKLKDYEGQFYPLFEKA